MAPELNNPHGMAAAALVAAVFLAAGVWPYVQGSRAAQHTRAAESETDGRERGAFPAAAPQESIANNMGVDYTSQGKYEEAIGHFEIAVAANGSYLPGYKNLLAA